MLQPFLRAGLLGGVDDGLGERDAGRAGGAQVVEVAGHGVELLGADDEVEVGQAVEQLGAAVLCHATEDTEHELGAAALAHGDVLGLGERFLLGEVAHGAGVEQEDVAVVLVVDEAVAAGAQHRRDGLAVALVHLAAVGLQVDAVHA